MPVSLSPALELCLDLLRCPVGHTFDIARHGYTGLLTGTRATSGDDPTKEQRLHRALNPFFEAAVTERVECSAPLSRVDAWTWWR